MKKLEFSERRLRFVLLSDGNVFCSSTLLFYHNYCCPCTKHRVLLLSLDFHLIVHIWHFSLESTIQYVLSLFFLKTQLCWRFTCWWTWFSWRHWTDNHLYPFWSSRWNAHLVLQHFLMWRCNNWNQMNIVSSCNLKYEFNRELVPYCIEV